MQKLYLVVAVLCFIGTPMTSHGEEHDDDSEDYDLFDDEAVHDKEHIKEHLDGVANVDKNISQHEMEFLYFKEHDFDNNRKLDGIEMLMILQHSHEKKPKKHKDATPEMKMQTAVQLIKITKTIDTILDKYDTDKDGYLEFPEFLSARTHIAQEKSKHQKLK